MQRHTKTVERRAVLHHPTDSFSFSKCDTSKHRNSTTRINPLQNDYAGLEAAIAQAMPSDFEEIVAEKQIFWKRELALIFGQAQLAEIIKRRVL